MSIASSTHNFIAHKLSNHKKTIINKTKYQQPTTDISNNKVKQVGTLLFLINRLLAKITKL